MGRWRGVARDGGTGAKKADRDGEKGAEDRRRLAKRVRQGGRESTGR